MREFKRFIFILSILSILSTILIVPFSWSQEKLEESEEDKQVGILEQKAESYYLKSLETCDEADIWKSIETIEELISQYPESISAINSYFTLAELLANKIQGIEGYNGAILAYQDYLSRFPWGDKAWEALYNIASVQYLYLKDYKAARESIEKLFDEFQTVLEANDDDMKKAKLLYAKIMHKSGELGKELEALKEIEFLDPEMGFGYQAELLRNIKANRILNDENDKFIFMGTFDENFPVKRLVHKFRLAEENVKKIIPDIERKFPLEIFVYQDGDFFLDTTDRTGSFASGADAQIFYIDGQPIEPLFAQIYAFLINNQASDLKVSFLETGFINAFSEQALKFDNAALNLGLAEEEFVPEKIFDNEEYAFLSEKDVIAAVFVDYLLTEYPITGFYRAFKMLEGGVKPEIILKGLKNVYGIDFDAMRTDFLNIMKSRRDELDKLLDMQWAVEPPSKFKSDQSSPEAVLISYFQALQAGKYKDFMDLTTGELHDTLNEAYKIYKEKKILDKVERWKMAIPYMNYKIEVTTREQMTGDMVAFGINLLKDNVVMERKSLVAVKKDGKWYIAQG